MRRIYAIWILRKAASPVFGEMVALVFLVFLAGRHFFVFDVFRNALGSSDTLYSLAGFFVNNFMLAGGVSKILSLGILMTIFLLGREFLKFKKRELLLEPTS